MQLCIPTGTFRVVTILKPEVRMVRLVACFVVDGTLLCEASDAGVLIKTLQGLNSEFGTAQCQGSLACALGLTEAICCAF
jgi:hypothetical protein